MIFFNVLKERLKDFHESSLLLRHRTGVFNSTVYRDKVMKDSTRWRCWAGDMSVTSLVILVLGHATHFGGGSKLIQIYEQ